MEQRRGACTAPYEALSQISAGTGLTLRSMASDFCRSKFRAVGRGKGGMRWGKDCLAVTLSWSWAVGTMEGTGGLGGTSLPCALSSPGPNMWSKVMWLEPEGPSSEAVGTRPLLLPLHRERSHRCPHLGASAGGNSRQGWAGQATRPGHFLGTGKGDAG